MAMEIFGRMLGHQYEFGAIGYLHNCECLKISHLAFADDILLFFNGTNESLEGIKGCLSMFQQFSGLAMNVQKSALFLAGIEDEDKRVLEAHGFKKGVFPVRYLGLPLMCRKLRIHEYAPLMDALAKRFGAWQLRSISYAGRLQLLKSVIGSLINFWGAAFLFPKGCVKNIEQLCQRFLWSGKTEDVCSHKVAWTSVCKPKDEGGLGLRNLGIWNKTLLLKLSWRIVTSHDSLWVEWIREHYLKSAWIWTVDVKDTDSWIWKAILSLRSLIKTFLSSKVNNGKSTSFWFDKWALNHNFFDLCGDAGCIKLGLHKDASVADAEEIGVWDRMQRNRGFRDSNLTLIQNAIRSLPRPSASDEEDSWSWSKEEGVTKVFSTSYTWNALQEVGEKPTWAKLIWFRGAVPSHAFIFWLAVLDRLPSFQRLYQWGSTDSPICIRCSKKIESRDHIFLGCEEGDSIWLQVTQRLGGSSFVFNDWNSFISWLILGVPRVSKRLCRVVIQATFYHLWRMRNLRIYEQKNVPQQVVFREIDRSVRDTLLARRSRRSYAFLLQEWFRWE